MIEIQYFNRNEECLDTAEQRVGELEDQQKLPKLKHTEKN